MNNSSEVVLKIGLAGIVLGIFSNGVDGNDVVSGDGPFSDSNGPLSELYALRLLNTLFICRFY